MTEPVPLRQRKKQQTRERILAESARLFAQQGYVSTTLDQIASAVDISVPTLRAYFASKDRLVTSSQWTLVDDLRSRLSDPRRELGVFEIWRRYVDEHATIAQNNRGVFLANMRLVINTPELRTAMMELGSALEDALTVGLAEELGPEALRQLPTRLIPVALTHGNRVTLVQWIESGGTGDLRAETLAVIDTIQEAFALPAP